MIMMIFKALQDVATIGPTITPIITTPISIIQHIF
jgi:hypothetical protein